MGQKNFSESDKEKIVNFDKDVHKKLERNINVCGDIFGVQIKNTIRFINFYYKSIRLFMKKIYLLEKIKIFIFIQLLLILKYLTYDINENSKTQVKEKYNINKNILEYCYMPF